MTKRIAWITDSSSIVPKETREQFHIYMAPLWILDGTDAFKNDDNFTLEQFYNLLAHPKEQVKTSQPAIGEVVELYEKLLETYDEIVVFSISSKVSGTFDSFQSAANMVDSSRITVFDTENAGVAKRELLLEAIQRTNAGEPLANVLADLAVERDKYEFYLVPADLNQLHKSGRVKGMQFFLGSLLKLQPIIQIKDGVITSIDKVRSEKKAKDWMFKKIGESKGIAAGVVTLYTTLGDSEVFKWERELRELYPEWDIRVEELPHTLAVHVGQGTRGFVLRRK